MVEKSKRWLGSFLESGAIMCIFYGKAAIKWNMYNISIWYISSYFYFTLLLRADFLLFIPAKYMLDIMTSKIEWSGRFLNDDLHFCQNPRPQLPLQLGGLLPPKPPAIHNNIFLTYNRLISSSYINVKYVIWMNRIIVMLVPWYNSY